MGIRVTCASCGSSFHVKAEFAGKTGACPKCRAVIHVPLDFPEPKPPDLILDTGRETDRPKGRHDQNAPKPSKKTGEIPPATEKQKEYARELGIDFPENINRRDISNLIQGAQDKQTDKRHERLFQVQEREGKQYEELRKEIAAELYENDKPLSKATPDDMAKALEERNLAVIILMVNPEDVGSEHAKANIVYGDGNLEEQDMRDILLRLGNAVLTQEFDKMTRKLEDLENQLSRGRR